MKKIGIFMLLIVFLTSCTINSKDFEFVSEEGSFLMDKTGVIKKDTDLSDKLILTYYLEPTSYTSIKILSDTYEAIENLRSHDEVIVKLVPLMYLNDRYENDLSAELGSLL
ncbi:MAG TPA: hypothetical protein VFC75_03355, partial [Erysipelothrix sp.]|nr:hypothetical protein [Erysipelothrix sp.]